MTLKVPETLLRRIKSHALQSLPEECCGFLIGLRGTAKEVLQAVPTRNTAPSLKERRYTVDPMDFLRIEKGLAGSKQEVLGFYHSHPNAPARPSKYDLENAWPIYSYIILSIIEGKVANVASWTLLPNPRQFGKEDLLIMRSKD